MRVSRSSAHRLPALALLSGFAATVAISLPGLGLVRAGARHPTPFGADPGAAALLQTEWRAGWTEGMVPPARLADLGVHSLLMIALALTLLALGVGCANLAALVLTNGSDRRQELALRVAVGATPGRLRLQLASEAAPFLLLGAGLGLLLGMSSILLLYSGWPAALPRALGALPDPVAVALAVGLPSASVLLSALVPARLGRRRDVARQLATSSQSSASEGGLALRRILVIGSLGASIVLLTGTASLLRDVQPEPAPSRAVSERLLTLVVQLPRATYRTPAARAAAARGLEARIRAIPGVIDSSVASPGAWTGLGPRDMVHVKNGSPILMSFPIEATYHAVGPGFFRMLGLPMILGRDFTERDGADSARVVIVNQTFANRGMIAPDPIGKKVQLGHPSLFGEWYTVVGVVRDRPAVALGVSARPEPAVYLPASRFPPATLGVTVATRGDPLTVAPRLAEAIHSVDGGIVTSAASTLQLRISEAAEPLRWFGRLFSLLAVASALLSAGGTYALISYTVSLRRREIGIRMAVGARTRDISRLVFADCLRTARAGTLVGLFGALVLTRLLEFLFHGIPGFDVVVFTAAAAFLTLVALAAAAKPVMTVSRTAPGEAMRAE